MAENNYEVKETLASITPKSGIYNYYWKTYDYTGKTHKQMVDEHPYCT